MTINVGDKLPEATFRVMTDDGPAARTTADIFAGKTVILFAVPGAFTPTCHKNHLPGFVAKADEFKAKGIDAIYATSTNDVFVLDAWQKASGAVGKVGVLADGSADFAKAIGLENDMSAFGMGMRTKRYSMLVKDGVVASLNVEDSPGKADVSGADALLGQI
ncbi:peroxiredoxin [Phreatobacter aquaticus]|uniref:Glutathione-dependent peroxiredoxin n=1 Tax=Phreatobacter aquaticus TaxID=2570229 RepID=A0A4D7QKZ9_9HYPH|nr:peroxiredoxin [Phreatobacter aquaticus]QCK88380.1 peroxiredoxin [Phreatobacter aquaticus]